MTDKLLAALAIAVILYVFSPVLLAVAAVTILPLAGVIRGLIRG